MIRGHCSTHLAGGRIFPGEHQRAAFNVQDTGDTIELQMNSADGLVQVDVAGSVAADLPATSIFRSVNEASAFFEPGVIGYSATASGQRLDGVVLKTHSWSVEPLSIERVSSSYFANEHVFPGGTVSFDCALIMRNIEHEWHAGEPMYL